MEELREGVRREGRGRKRARRREGKERGMGVRGKEGGGEGKQE